MSQPIANTELVDTFWPEGIQKRQNRILLLWIALAWYWLVMGTLYLTASFTDPGLVSPDSANSLSLGIGMIIFSIVLAAVCYGSFQRHQWATRVGICLSFIGVAPFLLIVIWPLYRIAALGEFLAAAAILTIAVPLNLIWWYWGQRMSTGGRATFYALAAAFVAVCLWRWLASEHSQEIGQAFPNCCLLAGALFLTGAYVHTCRKVWLLK